MKRKKNRKRRTGLGIVAFAVFALCVVITYGKVGMNSERRALEEEKAMYEEQLERLVQERENMTAYKEHAYSNENYESIARQKLGLVYPNEIIFQADGDE